MVINKDAMCSCDTHRKRSSQTTVKEEFFSRKPGRDCLSVKQQLFQIHIKAFSPSFVCFFSPTAVWWSYMNLISLREKLDLISLNKLSLGMLACAGSR